MRRLCRRDGAEVADPPGVHFARPFNWPAAFNNELISHNDTFVDALVAFAGSSGAR